VKTWRTITGGGGCRFSFCALFGRAGGRLIAAALLGFGLAGCDPAPHSAAPPAGTNAAAPRPAAGSPATALRTPGARTNAPAVAAPATARVQTPGAPLPPAPKGPVPPAPARPGTGTNALASAVPPGVGTNAASATGAGSGIADQLRALTASRVFFPVLGIIVLSLCLVAMWVWKRVKAKEPKPARAEPAAAAKTASPAARKKPGKSSVHSCNVLQVDAQARQLWQFDAKGRNFVLNREHTVPAGKALPASLVAKDWRSLFQPRLNVAWLPPERVFLRVVQLPVSDLDETLAMVELQLERLSPFPVAQIVWSIQILPPAEGNLQTVIVLIASRNEVEEFLGALEGQGYLADRLELPLLDQLQATAITGDGAWVYPEPSGSRNTALVAWWYGGVLQNLGLLTLPPSGRPESLREQLLQMAWAGELEGWLTTPPTWHLVADGPAAADWEPPLRTGLAQPVELVEPVTVAGLAALTATRATRAGAQANLLPEEYATRYRQQFVDRLWMRGLGAIVALYLAGVLIYFARLQVELYRTHAVEQQAAERGPIFTNALQLKAKLQVLKDRQDLKFAALDCWKAVAELLPDGVTLESYNFSEGKKLTLSGTAPADQTKLLTAFHDDIRKVAPNGQLLFNPNTPPLTWERRGETVSWHCVLELRRTEAL